jgi:4'-phosphopantetheinyl transferase
MIKIYYADLKAQLNDAIFFNYLNLFPIEIKNKILKFHRWEDAQASLLGKLLLKNGLKNIGIDSDLSELKYTKYGRPYIENVCDFNISHSGQYIVCAISTDGKIGVDVEEIKPIALDGFRSWFPEEEWAEIITSKNIYHAFYYYWTAKESIIKAEGSGLSIPIENIVLKEGQALIGKVIWYYKPITLFDNCVMQIASDKKLGDISFIKMEF